MTQHVDHAGLELAVPGAPLPPGLSDRVVDAITWRTDPDGRATALASLIRDLYETTAWRLNGADDSAMELGSLHQVLLAVDAHCRRMSHTDNAYPDRERDGKPPTRCNTGSTPVRVSRRGVIR